MKLDITVKPNSKRPGVEQLSDGSYRVSVNAPPIDGRANEAVIEILAKYFSVSKSSIHILRGGLGRKKVVEIILANDPKKPSKHRLL
ncbi:MAG: DUF167 domain-containing protein [Deltaproteobacteria bacterium]|nr:MAG: DUF167 domain-containing protein [Deltaproteobacteria bacterium]